ncbi:hypothetical protein Pcinc_030601, partial [Petrolisthes cinctipes]
VTVGWAIAEFLASLVPYPTVSSLLLAIIHAWEPKPQDNYWDHVKENVAQTRTPLADSITTSVIANRYLTEAALLPSSMTVDFADIASVHTLILKDVAESYTVTGGEVSRWWVDLNRELDHYIAYAVWLEADTITWRDTKIQCLMDIDHGGYDEYVITDDVREYTETCKQLHVSEGEEGPCTSFCDLYQFQVNRDDVTWLRHNLGVAREQWGRLKLQADAMAKLASKYYNPFTRDQ